MRFSSLKPETANDVAMETRMTAKVRALLLDLQLGTVREVAVPGGYNQFELDKVVQAETRDSGYQELVISGRMVTVFHAYGAKNPDAPCQCWGLKGTNFLCFSSAVVLAEENRKEPYSHCFDTDCTLTEQELLLHVEWKLMSPDGSLRRWHPPSVEQ